MWKALKKHESSKDISILNPAEKTLTTQHWEQELEQIVL